MAHACKQIIKGRNAVFMQNCPIIDVVDYTKGNYTRKPTGNCVVGSSSYTCRTFTWDLPSASRCRDCIQLLYLLTIYASIIPYFRVPFNLLLIEINMKN